MTQLGIFKEEIIFRYWGEVYLGLKAQWITSADVLDYCLDGKIKSSNDTRYVALYIALDDSLHAFYEQIKIFIEEDANPPIHYNEDSMREHLFEYIPLLYWRIWKLEFLLKINELPVSNEQKLEEIAFLFDAINYPEEWKPFLFYQNQGSGLYLEWNETYQNFINHIDHEISELHN